MQYFFIGSLPYEDVDAAIKFVQKHSPTLPFLPQLPRANAGDSMVRQILKGFELNGWNRTTSIAFEPFFKTFHAHERIKIQLAGPYTVAWFSSKTFNETRTKWIRLWHAIADQIKNFGFKKELWLQLDEPIWSKDRELPKTYLDFIRETTVEWPRIRVGIHSCASDRPCDLQDLSSSVQFFSFDVTRKPFSAAEKKFWQNYTAHDGELVLGCLLKGKKTEANPLPELNPKQLWISASCGLADWLPEEIEEVFPS